jgi:hypothetical protein
MTKIAGCGSISQRHRSPDPIRIHTKMSWIRNTAPNNIILSQTLLLLKILLLLSISTLKTCLLHDTPCGQLNFKRLYFGRNSGSNAGTPNYFGVCYAFLLPRDNAGVFTDVLSKLFLLFVFPHLFFT